MGGGGAMRAAAKVAGITVANSTGLRGLPSLSPAEHPFATATRKASRPASSIVSSSDKNNYPIEAAMQRPCWELDDWEFAGGEDEMIGEPMPRLVFGGVPTIEEAREATSQLKDALDKVYPSSPYSTGSGDGGDHDSDLLLFPKPESLETKSRGTGQGTVMSVPKDAIKAFRLLSESRVAQSVVASIASDPKLWDAVLENEAVVEFFKSQKSNMDPVMEEYAADASLLDQQSSTNVSDYANGYYMEYFQGVKNKVVDMMSTLSDYFQELFGGSTADTNGSAETNFSRGAVTASFMGLAVMVIMLVVMKRA